MYFNITTNGLEDYNAHHFLALDEKCINKILLFIAIRTKIVYNGRKIFRVSTFRRIL